MKILFCNKYNWRFSGTEVYLFELMDLLRSHGHEVALFSMADPRGEVTPHDRFFVPHIDFRLTSGVLGKASRAAHAVYSWQAKRRLRAMIDAFRPDVAHVRNIYHHLSPSILWELKERGIPVLQHLNDFKLLCPSYNLVSQGETCEACKGGAFWRALGSDCYPDAGARVALVAEAYTHRFLGTYRKCVDLFLAPSAFVRDKFVEHGWSATRFEVLSHFQKVHDCSPAPATGSILYFGRLSAEKGVDDLLHAMKSLPERKLVIAGDGPEQNTLKNLAASLQLKNVEFTGHVDQNRRDTLISQSLVTILPSHAYETLGKTILESYALGRAVIASDIGSRREFVHDGKTGLLYRMGDIRQLSAAIALLTERPELAEKMGRAGHQVVSEQHNPEEHYEKLLGYYERVIAAKRRRRRSDLIVTKDLPASVRSILQAGSQAAPSANPAHESKLRVAFIGGRGVISKYSGIEAYYEEVGSRLANMGHDVTVYCRNYFTPKLTQHNGMRLVRLPTLRSKHFETVIHTLLSTCHAITRDYDVIHYHALGAALFSAMPRLFGKKTAVTVQGLDWQRKKWGHLASAVLRWGERASVSFPNGTTVVSQALQRRYEQIHRAKTFYTPNGGVLRRWVEPRKIVGWDLEPGNYVLFLGRFSPEKGCHYLVDAFERIDTNAKLVLAGASSYCDEYSRNLRSHASDRIRILDWVSGETLDELLTNAMIFVLPSDLEGLSLALLDAMGAGLCVLTTDVPENREVVDGAGFTFQRGSVEDLADRLRFLIANPAVREAAGKAARRRIEEHYQWDKIAGDIEAAYFSLLGKTCAKAEQKKLPINPADSEQPMVERRAG